MVSLATRFNLRLSRRTYGVSGGETKVERKVRRLIEAQHLWCEVHQGGEEGEEAEGGAREA